MPSVRDQHPLHRAVLRIQTVYTPGVHRHDTLHFACNGALARVYTDLMKGAQACSVRGGRGGVLCTCAACLYLARVVTEELAMPRALMADSTFSTWYESGRRHQVVLLKESHLPPWRTRMSLRCTSNLQQQRRAYVSVVVGEHVVKDLLLQPNPMFLEALRRHLLHPRQSVSEYSRL